MADLITLDDYKTLEGLSSTTNDDQLDEIITSVSQLVKTYCNNDFVDSAGSPGVTDVFDLQWNSYVVQLRKSPIIDITGVWERGSQSTAYTELFRDGAGSPAEYSWYLDTVTDSIFRTAESGIYKNWPRGTGSVKVSYTAGYNTIPADLKFAVADLITYYHKNEYKVRQTIGSTSKEGAPSAGESGFPPHIKRVLDLYRLR